MSDRTSALYVCDELVGSQDSLDWRRIVLSRVEQVGGRDAHVTMVRLDDQILYLIEGEGSTVTAFLEQISQNWDGPEARVFVGQAMARWDSRPGLLMTPILSDDEKRWLSARLDSLVRDAREIQACLRWANMRTRESAFLDFGHAEVAANDSFPSAILGGRDGGLVCPPTSLDFTPDQA